MPAAVAARPRDERGYPVLAITPWEGAQPRFAATGTARTYLCAVERRCSICGTIMEPGPVWRVVAGVEADAIDEAITAGRPYLNNAATVEAPGHRSCMLYAAVVCPYLAQPTARRGQDAQLPSLTVARGDKRGLGGAVVGFDSFEFRHLDVVLFRFRGVHEFRRHHLGEEQLGALTAAVAAEATAAERTAAEGTALVPRSPAYLLADEAAAERRFASYVNAG
jgi:hypothetical protein